MSDIATIERELNALLESGRVVEAVERYYHDDVVMQENLGAPMSGKAANLAREKAFFEGGTKVNELKCLGSAVAGDASFSEWSVDLVLANGYHMKNTQVAARKWKDGRVVHERFYYDPKGAA